MLIFVIHWLEAIFGVRVPVAFEHYSTRIALAAITSLILTIGFGKIFIKKLYEWKVGDRVRTEDCPLLGELHRSKNDTPTMGGILILFSLLISLFLWMDLKSAFTLILLVTTLMIGGLGGIDDYLKLRYKNKRGVSGKKKLLVQGILGGLVALYLLVPSVAHFVQTDSWFVAPKAVAEHELTLSTYSSQLYIPFFKIPIAHLPWIVMGLFIVIYVAGFSNAVNLTDGLDGLATGTVMLSASALALIAFISNHLLLSNYLNILYIEGSGEIAIYLAAVAGACLGFLWYNGHPAQVFMGDTGSLTLGAILGVSAVLLKRELLFVIIGGIFVMEALSVMLQVGSYKWRHQKRIFLCAPLHHHFEYKGWAEPKVVIRFWIISLLLALVGIATLKFQ